MKPTPHKLKFTPKGISNYPSWHFLSCIPLNTATKNETSKRCTDFITLNLNRISQIRLPYAPNLMPRKSLENQKTKWHPDLVPHSVISPWKTYYDTIPHTVAGQFRSLTGFPTWALQLLSSYSIKLLDNHYLLRNSYLYLIISNDYLISSCKLYYITFHISTINDIPIGNFNYFL